MFTDPLIYKNFPELTQALLQIAMTIAIPLVTIFILYAGFLFVTAAGREQQVTKAKNIFSWSLIGAALIIGAWVLAVAIVEFFETLTP